MNLGEKVVEFFIKVCWFFDMIHIPEWDNINSPYLPVIDVIQNNTEEDEKEEEQPIESLYGESNPLKKDQVVKYWVHESKSLGADISWDLERYDGKKSSSYNFTEWHKTDDEILSEKRWTTEATRKSYKDVRGLVVKGCTNMEISKELNRSLSSVEAYAAGVRRAFHNRQKGIQSPSPDQ